MEDHRELFLLKRDGLQATTDWYLRTAILYKRASNAALKPREDTEALNKARGKKWADIYLEAAKDCLRRHRRLKNE